jgi:hypothetical protein
VTALELIMILLAVAAVAFFAISYGKESEEKRP